jgi:hypothetical protein
MVQPNKVSRQATNPSQPKIGARFARGMLECDSRGQAPIFPLAQFDERAADIFGYFSADLGGLSSDGGFTSILLDRNSNDVFSGHR